MSKLTGILALALALVVLDATVSKNGELQRELAERTLTIETMQASDARTIALLRGRLAEAKHQLATIRRHNEVLDTDQGAFTALVTAYTAYAESTNKSPVHPLFNVTSSGLPGGYGVCAADTRYWRYGTVLLIHGLGICVILDKGGAIKGEKRFDYMFGGSEEDAVRLALKWGRRYTKVTVLGHIGGM